MDRALLFILCGATHASAGVLAPICGATGPSRGSPDPGPGTRMMMSSRATVARPSRRRRPPLIPGAHQGSRKGDGRIMREVSGVGIKLLRKIAALYLSSFAEEKAISTP